MMLNFLKKQFYALHSETPQGVKNVKINVGANADRLKIS